MRPEDEREGAVPERDERGPEAPVRSEDEALAAELLTASLVPAELPAGGWERLRASLTEAPRGAGSEEGTPATGDEGVGRDGRPGSREAHDAAARDLAARDPAARDPATRDLATRDRRSSSGPVRRPLLARVSPATGWAIAAVAVIALSAAGVWGYRNSSEAARLRDDQRILAYWMSNPDMRLTALEPADGTASGRLGVLCVLPDGRALVLQPNPARGGATYVVVGHGKDGVRELTRGQENMLQFDAAGLDLVELRLARGDDVETLALARLD